MTENIFSMRIIFTILKYLVKLLSTKELSEINKIVGQRLMTIHNLSYLEKSKIMRIDSALSYSEKQRMPSPASPLSEDIESYQSFLFDIKPRVKTLLLGATPELRDLLTEFGINTYIVADFSFPMIIQQTSFCKRANPENEIWLKANWLEMPLERGVFDLILGDLILHQFPVEAHLSIINVIKSLLAPNGRFIGRFHIMNLNIRDQSTDRIIGDCLLQLSEKLEPAVIICDLIMSRLRDRLRDDMTKATSPNDIMAALRGYRPRHKREKEVIENAILFLKNRIFFQIPYITLSEDETFEIFKTAFGRIDKKNSRNYPDADFFPIYCLRD